MLSFMKSRPKELKGLKKDFALNNYYLDVYVVDSVMYIRENLNKEWYTYPLNERSAIEFKNNFSEAYRFAFLQNKKVILYGQGDKIQVETFEVFPLELGIELYKQGFFESVGYVENVLKEIQ